MSEKINNTNFIDPKFNIVSNVKALPENDAKNIKNLLIDQIFKTVKWRESIINISKMEFQILLKLVQEKF